ncbi:nucleoside deaminase [Ectothiorhodospira lacustris]|uniref:nucleoside deaminase n=1 Tax=Ectothiorhodospira lacustris TaxID=2899127 RepID=UPI001EE7A747|nr:nucleoside deaminase [Ectothiorhodospira lacustris]MCG5500206.1 nucleoside deaminase [Ectothiorhodospira lacustris]MCG5509570.1 nucleoside deaminase [Ectothiorhodospira lacustris]MCG5521635.1 nucleoside deaminase [Ectothiorhodospira lacustris]
MELPALTLRLPDWLQAQLQGPVPVLKTLEEQARFAIDLSRQNVIHGTGGPFGAAVFDEVGTLLAPGVNMVVSRGCSILHGEMVALAMAQQVLGRHDLSDGGQRRYRLAVSAEPCAMCMGALPWSGIRELVYAAQDEDVRAIGFDEGDKPAAWQQALERRGIRVTGGVLREEAVAVLNQYLAAGGRLY